MPDASNSEEGEQSCDDQDTSIVPASLEFILHRLEYAEPVICTGLLQACLYTLDQIQLHSRR